MAAVAACTISTTGLLEAVSALVGLGLVDVACDVSSQNTKVTLTGTLGLAGDTLATVDAITSITAGRRMVRLPTLKALLTAVPSSVGTVALAFFDAAPPAAAYVTLTYGSSPQRVLIIPNLATGA